MERVSKLDDMPSDEREALISRLHQVQNGLCYIDQKVINLQVHDVDIDHIIALARGGPDDESNWGLTHKSCNRSKGARDLRLQRLLVQFKSHVDKYTSAKGPSGDGNFTLHEALGELVKGTCEVGVQRKNVFRKCFRQAEPRSRGGCFSRIRHTAYFRAGLGEGLLKHFLRPIRLLSPGIRRANRFPRPTRSLRRKAGRPPNRSLP